MEFLASIPLPFDIGRYSATGGTAHTDFSVDCLSWYIYYLSDGDVELYIHI
jgi:hypothetical protein